MLNRLSVSDLFPYYREGLGKKRKKGGGGGWSIASQMTFVIDVKVKKKKIESWIENFKEKKKRNYRTFKI